MNRIKEHKLTQIISRKILQEYYRGFEQRVQAAGFDSIEHAATIFLDPKTAGGEYVGLFSQGMTPKEAITDTTALATLEFIIDDLEGKPEALDIPKDKETESRGQPAIDRSLAQAQDIKLPEVDPEDIKAALEPFKEVGFTPDRVNDIATKAIDILNRDRRSSSRSQQRKPILAKIAQEIGRILQGDMSKLKEYKTRGTKK